LQADHQDRCWRVVNFQRTRVFVAGQDVLQFVVHDFDNLLAGGDGFGDSGPGGLGSDGFDKIAGDG